MKKLKSEFEANTILPFLFHITKNEEKKDFAKSTVKYDKSAYYLTNKLPCIKFFKNSF